MYQKGLFIVFDSLFIKFLAVNCARSQVDSLNTTAKHRESASQTDEADPVVDCSTVPDGQPVQ